LEHYNEICQRNLVNGKKGGRPKKVHSISEEETQVVFEKPYTNTNTNTNTNTKRGGTTASSFSSPSSKEKEFFLIK
ncbi:MAG: hypothetical protein IJD64_01675, partial [Clostridia bacterium]|nr:hypothetical protein [Clostridia bacterium]